MTIQRLRRNKWPMIFGFVSSICSLAFGLEPVNFKNYIEITSGSLSFSSMATAFLFASLAIVPALSDSKLMKALKQLKTDKKLLDRLLITAAVFFTNSLTAMIMLLFDKTDIGWISRIVISCWIGTGMVAIMETYKIIRILITALKYY